MKNFHLKIIILQPLKISICCMSVFSYCNGCYHPAGDVLWVFVEPGNVVP